MMRNIYTKIMPFIMLGVGLVALFFGLVLLAYIFVFGAMVGMILFAIAWIKMRFFSSREISPPRRPGRTYTPDE